MIFATLSDTSTTDQIWLEGQYSMILASTPMIVGRVEFNLFQYDEAQNPVSEEVNQLPSVLNLVPGWYAFALTATPTNPVDLSLIRLGDYQ